MRVNLPPQIASKSLSLSSRRAGRGILTLVNLIAGCHESLFPIQRRAAHCVDGNRWTWAAHTRPAVYMRSRPRDYRSMVQASSMTDVSDNFSETMGAAVIPIPDAVDLVGLYFFFFVEVTFVVNLARMRVGRGRINCGIITMVIIFTSFDGVRF